MSSQEDAASDAKRAIEAFMAVMVEARSMAAAGNVGADLDDVLRHASELLDVLDGVLLRLDAKEHDALFQARWVLRVRLERLREELRGGRAH